MLVDGRGLSQADTRVFGVGMPLTKAIRDGRNLVAILLLVVLVGCSLGDFQGAVDAETSSLTTDVKVSEDKAAVLSKTPANGDDEQAEKIKPESRRFVDQGSGQFVRVKRDDVEEMPSGQVGLNLLNVSIKEAADVILKETLNLSYVIDDEVSGTVTARTAKPIAKENLLKTFESILAANGLVLLNSGELYQIAPSEEMQGRIPKLRNIEFTESFGLYVLPLEYVSAAGLLEVLPALKQGGVSNISVDAVRNVLIFTGSGNEASNLLELVEAFDVDWMEGMSFALEPLVNSDPKVVQAEIESILNLESGPLNGVVRLMAIDRLQSLMVISAQPRYLAKVSRWIEELDRSGGGDGRQLYVYSVKNARSSDLSVLLSQVFSGAVNSVDSNMGKSGVSPVLEEFELGQITENIATPQKIPSVQNELKIIANEANNSLLILAYPHEFSLIERALERLDVMPLQVMIEATIAEVTLNDELKYGLQWLFSNGDSTFSFSSLSSGNVSSAFPGFSYSLAGASAKVVLNALSQVTNVNVISSPQLMVLDNQTARLQVGDQVPVATQSAVSTDNDSSPIVNSIEFKDTGVILDVTPRVTSAGTVVLNISQEVSDVVETTTSDIDSPTIQQRQISSSIAIKGGETVALGGLIKSKDTDGVSGVPLLSDIPILGNLFKTTSINKVRTELLVLITPQVIRNVDESRAVTNELRLRMKEIGGLGL